jgi:hypothetical protein
MCKDQAGENAQIKEGFQGRAMTPKSFLVLKEIVLDTSTWFRSMHAAEPYGSAAGCHC